MQRAQVTLLQMFLNVCPELSKDKDLLVNLFQKNSLNFVQILTCSVLVKPGQSFNNDEFSDSSEGFRAFSSYRQKKRVKEVEHMVVQRMYCTMYV